MAPDAEKGFKIKPTSEGEPIVPGNGLKNMVVTNSTFEVAVLMCHGLRIMKTVAGERGRVAFFFNSPKAAELLLDHRNGDITVNTREFCQNINNARDIIFAERGNAER